MTVIEKIKSLRRSDESMNDIVFYKGYILPPSKQRYMGKKFEDNETYLMSTLLEGKRLKYRLKVNEDTSMLEIGCSTGRTIIGMVREIERLKKYIGCDLKKNTIDWCNRHIGRNYPYCKFKYLNIQHPMYNPLGRIKVNPAFQYPFNSNQFDLIYMNSVLSDYISEEMVTLAKEFYRMLKPKGVLFFTSFAEENVPPFVENPKNYKRKSFHPNNIVRYEKNYLIKIFTSYGFVLDSYEYGDEVDGQSAFYFSKPKNEDSNSFQSLQLLNEWFNSLTTY